MLRSTRRRLLTIVCLIVKSGSTLIYCLPICNQSAHCSHPRQICFLTRPLDLFLVVRLQPGGGCLPLHLSWLESHTLQSAVVPSLPLYSADYCGACMVFRAVVVLHLIRFQGCHQCLPQGQSLRLPVSQSAMQTRYTDVTKDPKLSAL